MLDAVPLPQAVALLKQLGGTTPAVTAMRPPTKMRSNPIDWARKARNAHGTLAPMFSGASRWDIGTAGAGGTVGPVGGIQVAVCPGGGGGFEYEFGPDMGGRADVT